MITCNPADRRRARARAWRLRETFHRSESCSCSAHRDKDRKTAEDAFLFRAQTQNGRAGLLIEDVGNELDTIAGPVLERVSQQQQLAFSVYHGALCTQGQPGVADGYASISRSDVTETRSTDNPGGNIRVPPWRRSSCTGCAGFAYSLADDRERKRLMPRLILKCLFDVGGHAGA